MQSLYDSLHLPNPDQPDRQVDPWPEKLSGPEFAERVVNSQEFRQYILSGFRAGDIPQGVVKQLMDYVWGQPAKHVEVKDVSADPFASMSPAQVKAKLEAQITTASMMLEFLVESESESGCEQTSHVQAQAKTRAPTPKSIH